MNKFKDTRIYGDLIVDGVTVLDRAQLNNSLTLPYSEDHILEIKGLNYSAYLRNDSGKITIKNHGMSSYSPIATEAFVTSNVPDIKTLHGKVLTGTGNVTISASDVGARPDTWMPTAAQVGARASNWVPSWSQVSGKPSFATVATSGSYNDLTNKPSIPSIPSIMSTTEGNAGTATTQRTINAANLKAIVLNHSPAGARPASDVSSWAKASSKPSYTAAEVGAEPAFTKNSAFNKAFGTGSTQVARGNHTHDVATTGYAGFLSASDKAKLNDIEYGAQVNEATHLSIYKTGELNAINSSTGTSTTITGATTDDAGLVTTGTQTFAGTKTFNDNITVEKDLSFNKKVDMKYDSVSKSLKFVFN